MRLGKWFAVSCNGQMTPQEMLKELQRDKICPVMCYDEVVDGEVKTIIPLFVSSLLAEQFAKRNTPKTYTIGTMEACQRNIDKIEASGCIVEESRWPKKRDCTVYALDMSEMYAVETEAVGHRRSKT